MPDNPAKRKRSASRRAELLEIAAKIFAEDGYKETGIESILKHAGLTGPALYRHFSSKQEILDTICIASTQQGLNEALEVQSEPGLSAEERLRKLVRIRLDHLFGPAGHAHILSVSQRAHLSDMAREKILGMQREFRASCGALLKALRPEVSDKDIEFIFFSMQQLALYGIWHSKRRSLLHRQEYREVLERVVWRTLMA